MFGKIIKDSGGFCKKRKRNRFCRKWQTVEKGEEKKRPLASDIPGPDWLFVIQMLPDGVCQVTDCSSNGTFYNNQRLKYKQPYRLPKGGLLAIGDADNVLELK